MSCLSFDVETTTFRVFRFVVVVCLPVGVEGTKGTVTVPWDTLDYEKDKRPGVSTCFPVFSGRLFVGFFGLLTHTEFCESHSLIYDPLKPNTRFSPMRLKEQVISRKRVGEYCYNELT